MEPEKEPVFNIKINTQQEERVNHLAWFEHLKLQSPLHSDTFPLTRQQLFNEVIPLNSAP